MNSKKLLITVFGAALASPAIVLAEEPAPAAPVAEEKPAVAAAEEKKEEAAPAPTEEQPKVEEVKALEVDAAAAKEKVDALEGFQDVSTSQQAVTTTVAASDEKEKKLGPTARIIWGPSVGTGTFQKTDTGNGYVAQSFDIRPGYKFDFMGHTLKANLRLLFDYEHTTPNNGTGRQFTPYDTSLYLSDAELYKEPITDVTFGGIFRWYFPTSYESLNVDKKWGAAQIYLTADRSFGPLDVNYTFSFRKNFNTSHVKVQTADNSSFRSSDPIRSKGSTDGQFGAGGATTSFDMQNSIGLTYNITEQLAVSYGLLFWNAWKYNNFPERDEKTADNADAGRPRGLDQLWPSLEVAYDSTDLLKKVVDVPVSLSMSLGISALHPAQTADNEGYIWPTFYHSMAENRAANNYGSVSFSLDGTY